jgi:hypothetical protein
MRVHFRLGYRGWAWLVRWQQAQRDLCLATRCDGITAGVSARTPLTRLRWLVCIGTFAFKIVMPPLRNTGAACRPDAARRRVEYALWQAWFLIS